MKSLIDLVKVQDDLLDFICRNEDLLEIKMDELDFELMFGV